MVEFARIFCEVFWDIFGWAIVWVVPLMFACVVIIRVAMFWFCKQGVKVVEFSVMLEKMAGLNKEYRTRFHWIGSSYGGGESTLPGEDVDAFARRRIGQAIEFYEDIIRKAKENQDLLDVYQTKAAVIRATKRADAVTAEKAGMRLKAFREIESTMFQNLQLNPVTCPEFSFSIIMRGETKTTTLSMEQVEEILEGLSDTEELDPENELDFDVEGGV